MQRGAYGFAGVAMSIRLLNCLSFLFPRSFFSSLSIFAVLFLLIIFDDKGDRVGVGVVGFGLMIMTLLPLLFPFAISCVFSKARQSQAVCSFGWQNELIVSCDDDVAFGRTDG